MLRFQLVAAVVLTAALAEGSTLVIPHFIDTHGSPSQYLYAFDTTIYATYATGPGDTLPGPVDVSLYLFDPEDGQPLDGRSRDACNPCTYQLNSQNRKVRLNLDSPILDAGGYKKPLQTGFVVTVVNGDADGVNMVSLVTNSHTSATDLALFGFVPEAVSPGAANKIQGQPTPLAESRKLWVIPSFHASQGLQVPSSWDLTLQAVYSGGLSTVPAGNGATLDLYLFDSSGSAPLSGSNGLVCNPCSWSLDSTTRSRLVKIDELIDEAGAFSSTTMEGMAIIEVRGDADFVTFVVFESFIHDHEYMIDSTYLDPIPIGSGRRHLILPWLIESAGATTAANETDAVITISDAGGLAGIADADGATVDLRLFDMTSGLPLRSASGQDVCAPCSWTIGREASSRVRHIRLEDEIVNKGGFATSQVEAFATIDVRGDKNAVGVSVDLVSSRSSSTDLAVHSYPAIQGTGAGPSLSDVLLPIVLEKAGTVTQTNGTHDTTILLEYVGDPDGASSTGDATAELYLYDLDGLPLAGTVRSVCDPCSYAMDVNARVHRILVDDLIVAAGGFGGQTREGFARVRLRGETGNVVVHGIVTFRGSTPGHLSHFTMRSRILDQSFQRRRGIRR